LIINHGYERSQTIKEETKMKENINIIEITAEMAAEVGVILRGGPRFEADCTLVSKGRKVGNETVAVCACNEKQARLAIKRVMEAHVGVGIGVKIMSCTVNGQQIEAEEVIAMNTHQKQSEQVAKKEEAKMENKNEIKKIALVGETVDYTALAEALKSNGKKLLVGDALNMEHLNALFRVKGGSFEGVMVQAYLAHKGEKSVYSSEKLGFTPMTLSVLSSMSGELRAQLMKEALVNKAFALIGNAPAPTPEPQQTTTTTKEQSAPTAPTTEEVRDKVSAKLVELGQELELGKDVVAEINKFGSFAHQTLKMSEGDINALIQQGVDKVKVIQETEREELRKLGKELAENDMAEGDDDFYAENGLTIQDEIDATIGNGVLSEDEARKVVKEAYDSVHVSKTTEILIPDEEESQDTPAEDNHEDELAELVLVSLEGENAVASASVMARFVLDNTDGNMEEATEIVHDILGIFSSVDEIIELDNGLVISGVLVRDGQSHKVVVTEDFQGSILA
jgi:hypothetical protein